MTVNEAAERLNKWAPLAKADPEDYLLWLQTKRDALAAEYERGKSDGMTEEGINCHSHVEAACRATVERIRERIGALAEIPFEPGPYTDGWRGAVKDALYWLDKEAAR